MDATAIRLVVIIAIAIFGSSCSSGDGDRKDIFSKINADQTFRDISDFEGAPFKLSKEYDVSTLPMENAAYMGFTHHLIANQFSMKYEFTLTT